MENPGSLWVQSVAAPASRRTHHLDLHPSIRGLNDGPKADSRELALSEKPFLLRKKVALGRKGCKGVWWLGKLFRRVGCLEEGLGRYQLNQRTFILRRNFFSIGKPLAEPRTESIPHLGHRAVSSLSTHSSISEGAKTAKQWKQPQTSL